MAYILTTAVFIAVPLAALVWFIVSLVSFCKTPKDSEQRRARRVRLIVSSVTAGLLVVLPIVFIAMLYMSVIFFM